MSTLQRVLDQHLIDCPGCGSAAAVHVCFDNGEPALVRVVCAGGCLDTNMLRVRVFDALYPVAAVA